MSVEITFYLALPALAWLAAQLARRTTRSRFEPQLALIAGLALGSMLLRLELTRSLTAPVPQGQLVLATALPGMVDWFALGMSLAVLRAAAELGAGASRALIALARRPGLCWLIAVALYLVGVPAQRGELFLATYGLAAHVAIGLAALFVVLPVVAPTREGPQGLVVPFLRSGLLAWLGTISYGIYLWHFAFLHAIDTIAGQPRGVLVFVGLLVATAGGAVCLGAASWYLVERPAHRLYARRSLRFVGAPGRLAEDAA
jgi:peptidoglycan/LPS O-acetylase OafA/YrhL